MREYDPSFDNLSIFRQRSIQVITFGFGLFLGFVVGCLIFVVWR